MWGAEEFRPTFPFIWNDFYPDNPEYSFSGYYSYSTNSQDESIILNGLVYLTRYQIQVAEGTLNIKEELQFNFKNGEMDGPIKYTRSYCENNGETEENEVKNRAWKKECIITANFNNLEYKYKNIKYLIYTYDSNTAYSITQSESNDISLHYFGTIIELNTTPLAKRPVFKKIPNAKN